MADILDPSNYRLQWLSLPYFFATLVLVGMGVYVLVMRGGSILRAAFLEICTGLALVTATYTLAGSTINPVLAASLYKVGLAMVPATATGVFAFEAILAHRLPKYKRLILFGFVLSFAQSMAVLLTDWYVAGVRETSWGFYHWKLSSDFYHFRAGPLAPLHLGWIALWGVLSGRIVYRQLARESSPLRRRQLWGSLVAFATFALSLLDALRSYGLDVYPMSWLFFCMGAILLLRSLVMDDFVHTQLLDWRSLLVAVYLVAAAGGLWMIWRLATGSSAWVLSLSSLGVYVVLRLAITAIRALWWSDRDLSHSPLQRLTEQFAVRVQGGRTRSELAEVTRETMGLALGCQRIDLIMPSVSDWSWETAAGQVISEEATPDPLMFGWFLEHPQPLQRVDLSSMSVGDFAEGISLLLDEYRTEVIVPLVNRDELVGLLLLGDFPNGRPLSRSELLFLAMVQEHLTSALVYAAMYQEVNERVAMQKEVDLAAAIQSAFVSSADLLDYGRVQVSGLWAPATQCGGDWWSAHQLPGGRVLVLIGDVTGHGVAAAMVTAAAKGCYDVVYKLKGDDIDLLELLAHLDAAVSLAGAGRFHMTCFATLLDPVNGTVTYANAGHVAPYICRTTAAGTIELSALMARGNPLGVGGEVCSQTRARALESGDILVWYTDGIVECTDPDRNPFGERRMQRLLRKVNVLEPDARAVRDHIGRAVAAFQRGQPPDDDITLVVARVE